MLVEDVIPANIWKGLICIVDDFHLHMYSNFFRNMVSIFRKLWKGNGELKSIVEECYEKSSEILQEKTKEVLIYVFMNMNLLYQIIFEFSSSKFFYVYN